MAWSGVGASLERVQVDAAGQAMAVVLPPNRVFTRKLAGATRGWPEVEVTCQILLHLKILEVR